LIGETIGIDWGEDSKPAAWNGPMSGRALIF